MRLSIVVTLAVSTLGLAACGADQPTTGSPTRAAPPSPAVSLVGKKTTCANFRMLEAKATDKVLAIARGAGSDTFTATKAMFADFRAGIDSEYAASADPELKVQLGIYGTELAKLEQKFLAQSPGNVAALRELQTAEGAEAGRKIKDLCK